MFNPYSANVENMASS